MLPSHLLRTTFILCCLIHTCAWGMVSFNPIENDAVVSTNGCVVIEVFNILDHLETSKQTEESLSKKGGSAEKKIPSADSVVINELLAKAKPIVETDYKKAFKLTRKALEIAESAKNSELLGKTQNFMGNLYWYSGDYNQASEYYFNALKSYQQTNNQTEIAECFRNIGWIYMGQSNYALAEEYFFRSIEIHESKKDFNRIVTNYDDLGNLFIVSKQYEKGLDICKKSLELAQKHKFHQGLGTIYITSAILHFGVKNMDRAEADFQTGIARLVNREEEHYNICVAYIWYAKFKIDQQKLDQALELSMKAVRIAQSNNFLTELADAYKITSQIYKLQELHKEAYEYLELFSLTRDSLSQINNRNIIDDLSARMEYEQSKMQIKSLKQERQLAETKLESERSYKLYLMIIVSCLFVLAFYIYRSFLNKKKDHLIIAKAYKEIELQNKDISDSIDYALQIQQARLPHIEVIQQKFPEFFVLFLPRDIVSGDFYWYGETDSKKHILSVVDCTGHGIPGAFMSMIGMDALNYAILEKDLETPAQILNSANKFISSSLKQTSESSHSRDGMDAAICVFDENLTQVKYAGANRPLWIVRNQELLQFLPNKISIGGHSETNFAFQEQEISLHAGDSLFLFSDGYADQFGGKKNKKFLTKNLKNLLVQIADLPASEQQSILHTTLKEWKGEFPQIDDILIVGVKI